MIKRFLFVLILLFAAHGVFAQGTVMPAPKFTAFDNAGLIISGGKLCTYASGTTTPQATYSDQDLGAGHVNTNPVIMDSAGRATVYLSATSYKFVLYSGGTAATSDGTLLWSQDNVSAVPTTSNNVDVLGTAGETFTAGQCAYLSDGSGSKNAGQWYKCDSANTYSSTTNTVGIAPSAITAAAIGTIRLAGLVTGLSTTAGSEYFVGTAGAFTATAPANRRHIGQADTTTSMVVSANPPPPTITINTALTCGRLTLTTAVPITVADVTAATTLFYTPMPGCNQVTLFNGTVNVTDTLTETSVAVPATTSTMYDVFAFDNAGAVNIEVLAWTNDTTRATAISLQNGYLAKAATPARRYVGSFRTTAVSGQTEDSLLKRYVWNYYNRVPRRLQRLETTASWNYNSATPEQANASAANQVDIVVGVAEVMLDLTLNVVARNVGGVAVTTAVGIGEGSTTTYVAAMFLLDTDGADGAFAVRYTRYPVIGRQFYSWNEQSTNSGTTSFKSASTTSGITGWILG